MLGQEFFFLRTKAGGYGVMTLAGANGPGKHTCAQRKRGGFVKHPDPTFLDCSPILPQPLSLPTSASTHIS